MAEHFSYDVFISHASKDVEVAGGLRVWFEDCVLSVGEQPDLSVSSHA